MTLDMLIERLTLLRRQGAPGDSLVSIETEDDTWDLDEIHAEPTCLDDDIVVRIYAGDAWGSDFTAAEAA